MQLLGQHLNGDLDRGGLLNLQLFLLQLLLLLKLFHCDRDRMCWFLDLALDDNDSCLRVDGAQGFLVCRPVARAEKVREHVAMVSDKERVRHVGKLLGVLLGEVDGGGHLVSDDVIHVFRATGAWVTQPHDLVCQREGKGRMKEKACIFNHILWNL